MILVLLTRFIAVLGELPMATQTQELPTVKWSMRDAMDRAGIGEQTLATRLGTTRHAVRRLLERERYPLATVKWIMHAINNATSETLIPAGHSAKYTEVQIMSHDGEVKDYRAYPHHLKESLRWALWQRPNHPIYWVTAPYGHPGSVACKCTCPSYKMDHEEHGTMCKHIERLMELDMI